MSETHLRSRVGARHYVLMAASLAVFAALLALGTWQVQRLQWKEALLATIDARVHSAPRPLAEIEALLASQEEIEYRPVRVEGTFVHEAERHFFATHRGASGYYVYTPLRLEGGRYVFVNRGFVPFDRKDPATRPEGQVEGEVEVVGLARDRLDEKPSFIVPDNEPEKNTFFWKDLDAMAATAGLPADAEVLPFFIDANEAPNPGGLPVGGVTIIDLPNNHLQYAITWYGLAFALLCVFAVWLARLVRERRHPAP